MSEPKKPPVPAPPTVPLRTTVPMPKGDVGVVPMRHDSPAYKPEHPPPPPPPFKPKP